LLPCSYSLPQMAGGSASALSLSGPAQASLALRPAGSLSRPRRPLSRGSSPCSCPHKPLVSFQINRQLSGWNLPPLIIRAFGAHCQEETWPFSLAGKGVAHFTLRAHLGLRTHCMPKIGGSVVKFRRSPRRSVAKVRAEVGLGCDDERGAVSERRRVANRCTSHVHVRRQII